MFLPVPAEVSNRTLAMKTFQPIPSAEANIIGTKCWGTVKSRRNSLGP